MTWQVVQGDARSLDFLEDESVDLIVTSPPYFALRSYRDGDEHYEGQIGSEASPHEFLGALWACTTEWWRVLKPTGSLWVNLGDKYAGSGGHNNAGISAKSTLSGNGHKGGVGKAGPNKIKATRRSAPDRYNQESDGIRAKSLIGLPWRYAIGCVDGMAAPDGQRWILRAELVWNKPNGLPESITDRVRRSHEQWFHMTKDGLYFAAVDEVREPHAAGTVEAVERDGRPALRGGIGADGFGRREWRPGANPLGKLPGSVWTVASEPLTIPQWAKDKHLLPDHFACVDEATEVLTRRGWLGHDRVQIGDDVAGYDLDTGQARWTPCWGVHRYPYDGGLVAVEKRGLSMRLTPYHNVIVRRPHSQTPLRDAVVRAEELASKHAIPLSAQWTESLGKPIGTDLAALCGWVAAEGWVTSTGQMRLCQSVSANPEHVASIDALLARLPAFPADRSERKVFRAVLDRVVRSERDREYRGRLVRTVTWALPLGLSQELRRLMPDKVLGMWALALPAGERRAILDAFVDGDGHRRPDGRIAIFQKHRENLDVLQAVAVTLGYKARLKVRGRWVLYLTSGQRALTLRSTNGRNTPVLREQYNGIVWCPTTGTGTFFARRNGSVFITGNSFPQEWPRRIVLGWSPSGYCVECGGPRLPVVDAKPMVVVPSKRRLDALVTGGANRTTTSGTMTEAPERVITGYACACEQPTCPTRPAVVLDPFGGTGTTAMVAHALGRHGISVDLSADYCRLAEWRIGESGHGAKTASRTDAERQGRML